MESFYTIQGEGFHSGSLPILFELQDVMLDVAGVISKSWDEDLHPIVDIRTLINDVKPIVRRCCYGWDTTLEHETIEKTTKK